MVLSIKAMEKAGPAAFRIRWSDDKIQLFPFSKLQQHCTCAGCLEQDRSSADPIEDVRARKVTSVGRYALRVEFLKGCSSGIYEYELLRKLGEDETVN